MMNDWKDMMKENTKSEDVSNNLFIKYTQRLRKNNYICNV